MSFISGFSYLFHFHTFFFYVFSSHPISYTSLFTSLLSLFPSFVSCLSHLSSLQYFPFPLYSSRFFFNYSLTHSCIAPRPAILPPGRLSLSLTLYKASPSPTSPTPLVPPGPSNGCLGPEQEVSEAGHCKPAVTQAGVASGEWGRLFGC